MLRAYLNENHQKNVGKSQSNQHKAVSNLSGQNTSQSNIREMDFKALNFTKQMNQTQSSVQSNQYQIFKKNHQFLEQTAQSKKNKDEYGLDQSNVIKFDKTSIQEIEKQNQENLKQQAEKQFPIKVQKISDPFGNNFMVSSIKQIREKIMGSINQYLLLYYLYRFKVIPKINQTQQLNKDLSFNNQKHEPIYTLLSKNLKPNNRPLSPFTKLGTQKRMELLKQTQQKNHESLKPFHFLQLKQKYKDLQVVAQTNYQSLRNKSLMASPPKGTSRNLLNQSNTRSNADYTMTAKSQMDLQLQLQQTANETFSVQGFNPLATQSNFGQTSKKSQIKSKSKRPKTAYPGFQNRGKLKVRKNKTFDKFYFITNILSNYNEDYDSINRCSSQQSIIIHDDANINLSQERKINSVSQSRNEIGNTLRCHSSYFERIFTQKPLSGKKSSKQSDVQLSASQTRLKLYDSADQMLNQEINGKIRFKKSPKIKFKEFLYSSNKNKQKQKELHIFIEGKHQVDLSQDFSINNSREGSLIKQFSQVANTQQPGS